MEGSADPFVVEEQEPESLVPGQEEEEEGDISQESEEDSSSSDDDEQLAKTPRQAGQDLAADTSDSGVDDPTPLMVKKAARTKREEKWAREEGDDEGEAGAGQDEEYKELPKIQNSCGISELYTAPDKDIIGAKLHTICTHILNQNILVSPLNQEYTKNTHTHHSLVLGAWRTQLEDRYKMKVGFWRDEEDNLLRARCDELMEEGLCASGDELADLINSQTGSGKSRRPHKVSGKGKSRRPNKKRDPSARNVVGLYLGMDLPHRTAFECSQRLVHLLKGVSVLSKQTQQVSKELEKMKQENPTQRKRKQLWTQEEDKTLMELVLRKKSGGYKTVEQAGGRPEGSQSVLKIPWEKLSKEFENRRWGDLRDRWQVHLKPVLLQPELWEGGAFANLDHNLLVAVAETGAKSLQEVPWDKVMQGMPGHQPAFLKNKLKGLTRQQTGSASNLNEKVSQIIQNMRDGKSLAGSSKQTGRREANMAKKSEQNGDLIDHYRYLISNN